MPKPRWKADGAAVYEHGRIAFTCHTPKGAARIVRLLERGEALEAALKVYKVMLPQGELEERIQMSNAFDPFVAKS